MFKFNLLTQAEFFAAVDAEGDHALFNLIFEGPSTNDIFIDGLMDGYADYYDASIPRPEFTSQGLYLYLKSIFMQDIPGIEKQDFLDYWKMGYAAGWMLGLGENKHELFFLGRPRRYHNQWNRLRLENEGVDIMAREQYPDRHLVMYAVSDAEGIYVAEVDNQGILCTCACSGVTPECKHVRLVERISGWFDDKEIIGAAPVAAEA